MGGGSVVCAGHVEHNGGVALLAREDGGLRSGTHPPPDVDRIRAAEAPVETKSGVRPHRLDDLGFSGWCLHEARVQGRAGPPTKKKKNG